MVSTPIKRLSAGYVEMVASVNDWPSVSRDYIGIAMDKIEAGEEECEILPSGRPKLESLYQIAIRLESEASTKN